MADKASRAAGFVVIVAVLAGIVAGCSAPAQLVDTEDEAFVTLSSSDPLALRVASFFVGQPVPRQAQGAGTTLLWSEALWCSSAAKARAAFRACIADSTCRPGGSVPGPRLGSESIWGRSAPSDGFVLLSVAWQEGGALAWVALAGPPGQVTTSAVAALAGAQDAAIAGAATPPRLGTASFGSRATTCPAIWQREPVIPCAQVPAGLVADPGAAVMNGPDAGTDAFFGPMASCTPADYVAYDDVTPTALQARSLLLDAAADCGSSAAAVFRSVVASAAGPGSGARRLPGPAMGTRSFAACQSGRPACLLAWIEGPWVGEIIYAGPAATAAAVEAMGKAQDAELSARRSTP